MGRDKILNSVLPANWIIGKIGEICSQPQYGYTTSGSKKGNIKLLRTTDITSGEINWITVPYCKENPNDVNKYLLKDGDIVISRAGSVGISILIKKPELSVFASYLIRFSPFDTITIKNYFYHFLKSPFYWNKIIEKSLGIALPNVNATKLKEIEVPIPSLPEQRAIVAKIEQLFSELDSGAANLKKAQAQLKVYRQSVLKWAFEGKLTKAWRKEQKDLPSAETLLNRIKTEREEQAKKSGKKLKPLAPISEEELAKLPELPRDWKWIRSGELYSFVTSGSRGWARYYSESGAIFIRITNLDFDSLELDLTQKKIKHVNPPKSAEGQRTKVEEGDFLFSITGYLGMFAIAPKLDDAYVNQHISLCRPVNGFFKKFFGYWVIAKAGGNYYINKLQRGATKSGLGLDDIQNFPIPICSLEEQEQVVREIEQRLSVCDKLEETINLSLKKTESLRQSILKKAFAGQLLNETELAEVRSAPDWEPAEKLLERIKREKENQNIGKIKKVRTKKT